MKIKFLAQLLILGTLVACSAKGGASENNTTETKSVTVNGEAPEMYFKRFLYKYSGSCTAKEGLWFHFLSTFDQMISLPVSNDGQIRVATLALYLADDGSYAADYVQMVKVEDIPGGIRYSVMSKKRLNGRTHLNDEGKLVVDSIGNLSALTYNGKQVVSLSVTNAELSEGVANDYVVMSMVDATSGSEEYKDICPNGN